MRPSRRGSAAFTLVEMLIVVSLVAVVLVLAAPSFRDFILLQRLKSINAQVVTDLQYARSEAVSRGVYVQANFQPWNSSSQMSCYVFYTYAAPLASDGFNKCDCTQPEGSRCTVDALNTKEIRTVQVPGVLSVFVKPIDGQGNSFAFEPRTGSIAPPDAGGAIVVYQPYAVEAYIDSLRVLRTLVRQSGRVSGCTPAGSQMPGAAC